MAVVGGHLRVVEQVRAQLLPRPLDVIGDESRCWSTRYGKLDDSGLVAVCAALRL